MINKSSSRVFYFDFLRSISCLAVVLIHASAFFVNGATNISFHFSNFIDSLSRFSVPVFIMISGALMLDENYNYSHEKLISHIKRLISVFGQLHMLCYLKLRCRYWKTRP